MPSNFKWTRDRGKVFTSGTGVNRVDPKASTGETLFREIPKTIPLYPLKIRTIARSQWARRLRIYSPDITLKTQVVEHEKATKVRVVRHFHAGIAKQICGCDS